jgi:Asp-tRNA(Asn)/Glu-tRNA(Gln) amidotransferase C subunit
MAEMSRQALQEMAALCSIVLSDEEADLVLPNVSAVLRSLGNLAEKDPGDVDTADVFSALGD